MSGDGGRSGSIRKPLGPSGGNPPVYEGGGGDGGGHPGHMKFPGAPIHFDALNLETGATVRIVQTEYEGQRKILLDDQEPQGRWTPHPHRLGVVPA